MVPFGNIKWHLLLYKKTCPYQIKYGAESTNNELCLLSPESVIRLRQKAGKISLTVTQLTFLDHRVTKNTIVSNILCCLES